MKGNVQVFWKVTLTKDNRFNWDECVLGLEERIPEELNYKRRESEITYQELVGKLPEGAEDAVRKLLNYVKELTPENNVAIGKYIQYLTI